MAAVSVSPLPVNLSSMSGTSRGRIPLSNNSNAVNSPYRAVAAAAAASKQKRSHATIQREEAYGQPPPAKRQMLESHQPLRTPPRQQSTQSSAEGRVFTRKANNSTQSSFERKCISVRERPQQIVTRPDKSQENNVERLRWQQHHRKLFPTFVFYFESVPEDVRIKYTKQVKALGAREEKFFDKTVTHVVTTRNIPAEIQHTSTDAPIASSTTNESHSQNSQPQTINPSLLDRSSESANVHSDIGGKGKFTFEASIGKRATANASHDADVKRTQVRSGDVLHRAREMGMKIWALEKLVRMMDAMFDTSGLPHGHNTRSNSVQGPASTSRAREADLSQLLRNERINGPSDRDPTVATKELNIFKGPFIYVHDIDEKQKPIMVREYPKVAHKEDGDWPQFRSVANGKCPFVEDIETLKREAEKEREALRVQRQQEKEKSMLSRSRTPSVEPNRMQPPKAALGKRALSEIEDGSNRNSSVSHRQPSLTSQSKSSFLPTMEREASSQRSQQNAFVSKSRVGPGRIFAGEPVASGVQPSNTTSAICSNITSSTAPQPGIKAGTSKEVHGLQRKVLEKNSGGPASYGLANSHRMPDIRSAAREEARSAKGKGPEKLALIEEDSQYDDVEVNLRRVEASRKPREVQQKKVAKRDPKPGYCENCQDKFEDFDEHIQTRKHRRFADKLENWKDLDALIMQLRRPLREIDEDDF